jgi:hypothetical protein
MEAVSVCWLLQSDGIKSKNITVRINLLLGSSNLKSRDNYLNTGKLVRGGKKLKMVNFQKYIL